MNGCQGMTGSQNSTVKAKSPIRAATAAPPHQAVILAAGAAVRGVRPIHQHANHTPTISVNVGMKYAELRVWKR